MNKHCTAKLLWGVNDETGSKVKHNTKLLIKVELSFCSFLHNSFLGPSKYLVRHRTSIQVVIASSQANYQILTILCRAEFPDNATTCWHPNPALPLLYLEQYNIKYIILKYLPFKIKGFSHKTLIFQPTK